MHNKCKTGAYKDIGANTTHFWKANATFTIKA